MAYDMKEKKPSPAVVDMAGYTRALRNAQELHRVGLLWRARKKTGKQTYAAWVRFARKHGLKMPRHTVAHQKAAQAYAQSKRSKHGDIPDRNPSRATDAAG